MIAAALCAGALLAAAPQAPVPDALARLAWLAGCWRRETAGRVVEEQWMAPAGGVMLGAGRTVSAPDGTLVEYEQVRIEARGDTLAYVARPSGQPEATFTALAPGEGSIVFENATHDFPQRVGYRVAGADSVVAWIEGTHGGQLRRVEFPYRRAACPGSAR